MRFTQRVAALALVGTLWCGLPALAQKKAGGRAQSIPQTWLTRLNLSAEQQAKVQDAEAKYRADTTAAAGLTAPKEKRQAGQKARQDYEAAVTAVLNPDQQKTLSSMRDEAKEFAGMGPAAAQLVGLNLSSEQKTKIKAISAKYEPEMDQLRAGLKGAADKKAARSQIGAVNARMMDEVKAVLTADQAKMLTIGGKKPKKPKA